MKKFRSERVVFALAFALPLAAMGADVGPHDIPITVRGRGLTLHHFAPTLESATHRKILLASGDGGWKGFETSLARTMAGWGFDVCGLDTREYLKTFTGHNRLEEAEAADDFGAMVETIAGGSTERVILMGWSAGAALAVLAGASERNKDRLEGVAAVSLPMVGELAWHWSDELAFLPFIKRRGPFFSSLESVPKVAPLPLLIIQSANDKWAPDGDRERLFQVAIRPRRRVFLHAGGHSFSGTRAKFFEELRSGLDWIEARRDLGAGTMRPPLCADRGGAHRRRASRRPR